MSQHRQEVEVEIDEKTGSWFYVQVLRCGHCDRFCDVGFFPHILGVYSEGYCGHCGVRQWWTRGNDVIANHREILHRSVIGV